MNNCRTWVCWLRTWLACAIFLCSTSVNAQALDLGQFTRLVPYINVPFLTRETVTITGYKNSGGECVFPLTGDLSAEDAALDRAFVSVLRATNPESCEEIIERGLVQRPLPAIISGLSLDNGQLLASSAGGEFGYEAYVKYTDGRNPLISPFRNIFPNWDGIRASEVNYQGITTWGPNACEEFYVRTEGGIAARKNPLWKTDTFGSEYVSWNCLQMVASRTVVHSTTSKATWLGIDCSAGAKISYTPFQFRLHSDGFATLVDSNISTSGPWSNCLENLTRFIVIEPI